MESCGQKCLKGLLFIFNLLFFLGGATLLGLGIWVLVDGDSFRKIVVANPIIFNSVYVIIAVGAALLVISFFGCLGAIKENKCLLGTFFALVLIIFIVQIVGGILTFAFYPRVREAVFESMAKYGMNDTSSSVVVTQGWDTMQTLVQCCGFNDSRNWRERNDEFVVGTPKQIPESCCVRRVVSVDGEIMNKTACQALVSDFHNIGCETKIKTYYWVAGGTAIGVLAVELLAMIFTCCMYKAIDKGDYA